MENHKYGDLKDCPFCNNSFGRPVPEQCKPEGWIIVCANPRCGATSGLCDSEQDAISLWNQRPTDRNLLVFWATMAAVRRALKTSGEEGKFYLDYEADVAPLL